MVLELAQNVFKGTVFCLCACALSAGCEKTVVLGSECPAQEGPCGNNTVPPQPEASGDAPGTGDAIVGLDAGGFPTNDAAAPDAGGFQAALPTQAFDAEPPGDVAIGQTSNTWPPAPDASSRDAAAAISGVLQNPSFELSENPEFGVIENQYGSDVLVSDLAGYVPSAGEFFANIDPWFACWVGVQVESDLGGGLVASKDEALITTDYDPLNWMPGLFQVLTEPLVAGRSYSFALDVLNSGAGRSALMVGATNLPCTPPEVYGTTPELSNRNGWKEYCVTFQPTRELYTFALMPVDVAGDGVGQVSFDNVRQVDSCPQ